jgi:hypothetical protein
MVLLDEQFAISLVDDSSNLYCTGIQRCLALMERDVRLLLDPATNDIRMLLAIPPHLTFNTSQYYTCSDTPEQTPYFAKQFLYIDSKRRLQRTEYITNWELRTEFRVPSSRIYDIESYFNNG